MELVKIRHIDQSVSWTAVVDGETVRPIREWIIHLEEIHLSPNTIEAYARHITRLGRYLSGNGKRFEDISVSDYDRFLQWLPAAIQEPEVPENLVILDSGQGYQLSSSLKNQIHLAIKSFYRYLLRCDEFLSDRSIVSNRYASETRYRKFLEHINARRSVRQKDRYLSGDLSRVAKQVTQRRLTAEAVLKLIEACHTLRDAMLIVILYNTGMRIGEILGLRHTDMDLEHNVIWVVPRSDNENGARAKSGRTRSIPVIPYVMAMYEDYLLSDEYMAAFESGTRYVFCNIQRGQIGRALSRSYAQKLNQALIQRTGINFNWHLFRHTHASEAIADGHSLLQVADRLGHASPQTTVDFYRHLFSHEVRKLHLTSAAKLQTRLEELNQAKYLNEAALRW